MKFTLQRSMAASRMRDRWLKIHAGVFASLNELPDAKRHKLHRILNRIADRVDHLNPYPSIAAMPRL